MQELRGISSAPAVIPMTDIKLIEGSFADVIQEIGSATDVTPSLKSHWICSLTQIARWLDRPADSVAARLIAIRIQLDQLHHARLGVTAKTLANRIARTLSVR